MNRIHLDGDEVADRYTVTGWIGEGGMQEVYRAHDGVLARDVALKVPKNQSARRRFERSAILSARVNHPNTAKTLDYVTFDSRTYLIEELVDGQDLSIILKQLTVMDPYLVAYLLHHLARGVAASHHVGVVHRDLKPSNIMVAGGFNFSEVKVTDFGIARLAEYELVEAVEQESTMTASSTAMGAIPYMSPEMIQTPHDVSLPTDIWTIGAIAFHLLTGEYPFGTGLRAVGRILNNQRATVDQKYRTTQFSHLFDDVLEVVESCMDADPGARPSADHLVSQCGQLCYPGVSRILGTVSGMPYPSYGFIAPDSGGEKVFFHCESVYGPTVSTGDRVCFVSFSGVPLARAHPVLKLI